MSVDGSSRRRRSSTEARRRWYALYRTRRWARNAGTGVWLRRQQQAPR